jgi:bifunctional UDP-N-acetylglucosamine pyrophosphorylase / glucosamine-1-phosphate N-acetyltransferase
VEGARLNVRAIVLAAGKGTRMKSATTKVLHEICGRPLLWYTLQALRVAGIEDVLVVANEEVEARIGEFGVACVVQREQLGTGHAVRVALSAMATRKGGRVIVAPGDMPLVTGEIFRATIDALGDDAAMSLVTANMPLPSNFGRIIRRDGNVLRIVEVRDASPDEMAVDEMNAGIYAFDEGELREVIPQLDSDNSQGEYYLTDTVGHFARAGKNVRPVLAERHESVLGINDRTELAIARREMNARIAVQHMRDGVTIVDPERTYLEPELTIGRDTVIYPGTSISRLSAIGERCTIGPHSRLSNATIGDGVEIRESVIVDSTVGDGSSIGPFAHLRGNARLEGENRVGNFVEVKNSTYAKGAKSAHLSYLGDATIGENSNVGAGTITCNFDGKQKNATVIGKNVSIGSNTSIVAPRTIGDDALTGAGSVVTHDVAPGERVAGNPAKPLPKK